MKRFFISMVMYAFVLTGMAQAAETTTHTWTDENGTKHIVTITKDVPKSAESDNSGQKTAEDPKERERKAKEQPAPEKPGTDNSLPPGIDPNASFHFDIDRHDPKPGR